MGAVTSSGPRRADATGATATTEVVAAVTDRIAWTCSVWTMRRDTSVGAATGETESSWSAWAATAGWAHGLWSGSEGCAVLGDRPGGRCRRVVRAHELQGQQLLDEVGRCQPGEEQQCPENTQMEQEGDRSGHDVGAAR